LPNGEDPDIDGDGEGNSTDDDVDGDGDGTPNSDDDDTTVPCEIPSVQITGGVGAILCPNQRHTFQAASPVTDGGGFGWTGGTAVGSATTDSYTTRFSNPGNYTVGVTFACVDTGATDSDQTAVTVHENSGAQWVARFPGSRSTADLNEPFRSNTDRFIAAMRAAGATVNIASTYRPPERAYLMHWSYRISRGVNPSRAYPPPAGVNICWEHLRASTGNPNRTVATQSAQGMVNGYNIAYAPALTSRHTERRAIDMTITWSGSLSITNLNGTTNVITTLPRHGGRKIDGVKYSGNTELHTVGATYGLTKLVSDPPHWSDDGR